MRFVNFLLATLFLMLAASTVNTPNPVIWILIYGTMSVISIMAIFEYYPHKFLIAWIGALLLYTIFFFEGTMEGLRQTDDFPKTTNEPQQLLGLIGCIGLLIFYVIKSSKKS